MYGEAVVFSVVGCLGVILVASRTSLWDFRS